MFVAHCPLRISLFGGSTDSHQYINDRGYGSVISFASTLKTYVTVNSDLFGVTSQDHKYRLNYSKREDVSDFHDIKNEVIRTVLQYFNVGPLQINLLGDTYSQGSGLATSSSYTISLIKAISMSIGRDEMSPSEICHLAYDLERFYNPYCGMQDPYGCGVGGFKRMEFYPQKNASNICKYTFYPSNFFSVCEMHLIFTGVTRNSKPVLKNITQNLDKVDKLLPIVEEAHKAIIESRCQKVLELVNESWEVKKKTSSIITENEVIQEMDKKLSSNKTVLAHKLCGAGNGGFFLVFSKKKQLKVPYHAVKIDVSSDGVIGREV